MVPMWANAKKKRQKAHQHHNEIAIIFIQTRKPNEVGAPCVPKRCGSEQDRSSNSENRFVAHRILWFSSSRLWASISLRFRIDDLIRLYSAKLGCCSVCVRMRWVCVRVCARTLVCVSFYSFDIAVFRFFSMSCIIESAGWFFFSRSVSCSFKYKRLGFE